MKLIDFAICRDAAALACMCKDAAAAAPKSKWHSAVRIGLGGFVLAPASGTFDVTVPPGEAVQAAVDRCPPGGCVLLLPGMHDGPLALEASKEVHVFGRGRATLRTMTGTVLSCGRLGAGSPRCGRRMARSSGGPLSKGCRRGPYGPLWAPMGGIIDA